MWILVPNIDLRCFRVRQLLSRIYALLGVQFQHLKIALAYKKWQITGMGGADPFVVKDYEKGPFFYSFPNSSASLNILWYQYLVEGWNPFKIIDHLPLARIYFPCFIYQLKHALTHFRNKVISYKVGDQESFILWWRIFTTVSHVILPLGYQNIFFTASVKIL